MERADGDILRADTVRETADHAEARHAQVAALPVRKNADGGLSVLLITSRETRRWVIPKGWPWPNLAEHIAAAGEAREEAGLIGVAESTSLGCYCYSKRRSRDAVPVRVTVYLMRVTDLLDAWPEAHQRSRAWFDIDEAAAAVEEPELRDLILGLRGIA